MKNTKGTMLISFLVFGLVLGGFFIFVLSQFAKAPAEIANQERFNDSLRGAFNYSFAGTVADYEEHIIERGTHIAIATIDLKQSDIHEFDPSDSSDVYFCLIRNGKAKVMFAIQYGLEKRHAAGKHGVALGDSLVFDGESDKFYLYFEGDSTSWPTMWFSPDPVFRRRVLQYLK